METPEFLNYVSKVMTSAVVNVIFMCVLCGTDWAVGYASVHSIMWKLAICYRWLLLSMKGTSVCSCNVMNVSGKKNE